MVEKVPLVSKAPIRVEKVPSETEAPIIAEKLQLRHPVGTRKVATHLLLLHGHGLTLSIIQWNEDHW